MRKGSRSKKTVCRKIMLGSLLCIAALCAGCGKKASEEAVQTQVPTIQETTTQAAASAPQILIQSDEEKSVSSIISSSHAGSYRMQWYARNGNYQCTSNQSRG